MTHGGRIGGRQPALSVKILIWSPISQHLEQASVEEGEAFVEHGDRLILLQLQRLLEVLRRRHIVLVEVTACTHAQILLVRGGSGIMYNVVQVPTEDPATKCTAPHR